MKLPRCTALFALFAVIVSFSGAAAGVPLGTPEEMGMRKISGRVYVDPELPSEQAEKALQLVEQSRQRVAAFYGQAVARPNIIFCATAGCYRSFGAIGLGYTDGTNVIISPHGRRIAILAHELAHMELSARIGGFEKVLERVPQWFDEGQAVMVSQAEEFSEVAWKTATRDGADAPALSSLESMADWNRITGVNGENMQYSYGTARREVGRWFSAVGLPGFKALLSALSADDAFDTAYSRAEGMHSHPVDSASLTVQAVERSKPNSIDGAGWAGNSARAAW